MRVVTFNIQHGRTPAGRVDVGLVGRVCAGFDADVLALQEVDVRRPRSGWVDTVKIVSRATGLHGVFGRSIYGYGNAFFARTKPVDVAVCRLPRHGRNEPRSVLLGAVDGVSFAVTHLSIDAAESAAQLAAAVGSGADVLVGDLNMRPEQLAGMLPGAALDAAPTWPADNPRIRIDHVVALSPRVAVTSTEVLDAPPVSDHRPVLAEVRAGS